MHVLGVANAPDPEAVDPSWVRATTTPSSRRPVIACAKAASVQLILYDRPKPRRMQYISLEPIALALGDKGSTLEDIRIDGPEGEIEKQECMAKEARRKLVQKLKLHTITHRVPSARDRALPKIINQVNWSWELDKTLQKNVGRLGSRPRRSLSVSERVVESATTMRNYVLRQTWALLTVYLFPVLWRAFCLFLLGHRLVAEVLLLALEFRPKPGGAALKDISATAQQIEIRLQQFCYWPMQYSTLRRRKMNWSSVNTSHPDYIRFYNSLWLVANDVIIGMALGSYIIEHADWVAAQIGDMLHTYAVDALRRSISWLMGWPAGLKLNGELAAFLGDLFLWVIHYWSSECDGLRPPAGPGLTLGRLYRGAGADTAAPRVVHRLLVLCRRQHAHRRLLGPPLCLDHAHILLLLGVGANLSLAAHHSPVAVPPLPRQEAQCAPQPYRLVRLRPGSASRRHHLLHPAVLPAAHGGRILPQLCRCEDGHHLHEGGLRHAAVLPQPLPALCPDAAGQGPQEAARYVAAGTPVSGWADARQAASASNSEIPKATRLRPPTNVTSRRRLSSTSRSVVHRVGCRAPLADGSQSIPLSFGAMFHQYFQMAHRIRKHYLSPEVLLCLLTGQFVPPINRKNLYSLQYSMLPAKRATAWEMWRALNLELPKKKPFCLPTIPALANGSKRAAGSGRTRSHH